MCRMRLVPLAIAIVISNPLSSWAQDTARPWLDTPKPAAWNKAGAPIPTAPAVAGAPDPRCREGARPPQLSEDKKVRERGWDLVGAYQGGWQTLVIRGTAGYDGMCRPRRYQDFVFVRGDFAGTLSPEPMESRADGALSHVTLQRGQLFVEYDRYAAKDPLCCPSRTTLVVFEIASGPLLVRPVSTTTSSTSAPAPSSELSGTAWQLVKFEGSDGTTLTPDDRSKYTIEFTADGGLNARLDCNRGRGSWKSNGQGQVEFGLLALTRAACPPGSLHDQLVTQWGNVRSYVLKDGRLFLALMADGGIYEYEAIVKGK